MARVRDKTNKSKPSEQKTFMNPKTDFGFKKIFGDKELLIAFLNTILPETIVDIEYLPTEQFGYVEETRKAIYDVYAKTTDGKHLIIEMQIAEQKYFAERMLFYSSYSIINQVPFRQNKSHERKRRRNRSWMGL